MISVLSITMRVKWIYNCIDHTHQYFNTQLSETESYCHTLFLLLNKMFHVHRDMMKSIDCGDELLMMSWSGMGGTETARS